MKEISTDESTSDALRLFADISESKEVAISIYPEFLRDVANKIEQLEKKVSKYEYRSVQHCWLRRLRRNPLGVLVNKAKVKDPDIVKRLLDAYEDMRTGSRNDLKDAANEIERLRELADNLAQHLEGYVCHCNMSKCKCGYNDVMDEYKEVRGD